MGFLRVLGWIFVPYIMIFVRWKQLRGVGRAFGIVWAVLALLIGIGNAANGGNSKPTSATMQPQEASESPKVDAAAVTESAKPSEKPKETPKNKPTITKEEFDKLESGMTYDEATKIIGGPGEVLSESGKKGGKDLEIHTVMYQYKGEGSLGANANLMFQDEKLINKAQIGLK